MHVIDEVALRYVGDKFMRALDDNVCSNDGLRAFLWRAREGFASMRDDVLLAIIHATQAHIPHREVIHANLLMSGPR